LHGRKLCEYVSHRPAEATEVLAGMVERTMQLQCMIQDGIVSISNNKQHVTVESQQWLLSGAIV
jgi:uncharacterized protein YaeQ